MKWQPIKTAPKNGTAVILWDGEEIVVLGRWETDEAGEFWGYPGVEYDDGFQDFKYWIPHPSVNTKQVEG